MKFFITLSFILWSFHTYSQIAWEQMTDAPAAGRFWAAATGNSTHGYCGTGRLQFSGVNNQVADMYTYELATDSWSQIPDYPGGVREGMTGFTIGERVFFAFGSPFIQFTKTVYEYIPESNTWNQMPDVPGIGFAFSEGFVIDDTFYIGPENGTNKVYAFNATTETWSEVADFPGNDRRAQCTFSANGKGYLGMGAGVFSGVYGDWWEYDPIADSWTEIASIFPNADQACATAVMNAGYVYNTGGSGGGGQSLFGYDANTDQWNFLSTLPGDRVANAAAMTIGDQGFLVFGEETTSGGNISSNKLWRFTPGTTEIAEASNSSSPLYVTYLNSINIRIWSDISQDEGGYLQVFDSSGKLILEERVMAGNKLNFEFNQVIAQGVYTATYSAGKTRKFCRFVIGSR